MAKYDKFTESADGTQQLATGIFMQWSVKHGGSGNPVEYFKNKYGYEPTEYALADDLALKDIILPSSLSQSKVVIGKIQPGHILLR